jgi:hypothetical protein
MEMSEAELEKETQQGSGAEAVEEAERAEEEVGQKDDTIALARALIRAEVREVSSFRVSSRC